MLWSRMEQPEQPITGDWGGGGAEIEGALGRRRDWGSKGRGRDWGGGVCRWQGARKAVGGRSGWGRGQGDYPLPPPLLSML